MKSIAELPEGWLIMNLNLDVDPPYAMCCPVDGIMEPEEKFSIPKMLAVFLKIHWSGTKELRELHRREMAAEIKTILFVKD